MLLERTETSQLERLQVPPDSAGHDTCAFFVSLADPAICVLGVRMSLAQYAIIIIPIVI
jgi:hypothetical protein